MSYGVRKVSMNCHANSALVPDSCKKVTVEWRNILMSRINDVSLKRASLIIGLLVGLSLYANASVAQSLPVFPGAVGYGIDTPAGRGGKIFKVNNLNAAGPGSLEACTSASGARVCIFEVSGVIELTSDLTINTPYITICRTNSTVARHNASRCRSRNK